MRPWMKTKYYFTLGDFFDDGYDIMLGIENVGFFKDVLIAQFELEGEDQLDDVLKSSEANTLFCSYILNRYKNNYIGYIYEDDEETENRTKLFKEFLRKYIVIFRETYTRYKTLLNLYETNKTKLLDELKTVSVDRFNDTPQDGGDFSDDDHTSNYRKLEVTTPIATIMERLNEIDGKFKNLYKEWSLEFKRLFLYSAEAE